MPLLERKYSPSIQLFLNQDHSSHIIAFDLPSSLIIFALSLSPLQVCHVIARVISSFCLRNITMTPPVSSGFQALCFFPEVPPPHRQLTPLSPSLCQRFRSSINRFAFHLLIPTLRLSKILSAPTIYASAFLYHTSGFATNASAFYASAQQCNQGTAISTNAFLPLLTMLPHFIRLPPDPVTLPPSTPLPLHTCHHTSESIGFEALPSLSQMLCAQMICRQWPSGPSHLLALS